MALENNKHYRTSLLKISKKEKIVRTFSRLKLESMNMPKMRIDGFLDYSINGGSKGPKRCNCFFSGCHFA